jgi:hypothetical protein
MGVLIYQIRKISFLSKFLTGYPSLITRYVRKERALANSIEQDQGAGTVDRHHLGIGSLIVAYWLTRRNQNG